MEINWPERMRRPSQKGNGFIAGWNAAIEACKEAVAKAHGKEELCPHGLKQHYGCDRKGRITICSAHKPEDYDPTCEMCTARIERGNGLVALDEDLVFDLICDHKIAKAFRRDLAKAICAKFGQPSGRVRLDREKLARETFNVCNGNVKTSIVWLIIDTIIAKQDELLTKKGEIQ